MTAGGHHVTLTETHSPSGHVYWESECTCRLWHAIHVSRMTIAEWGADHLRVVQQLAEQASQR